MTDKAMIPLENMKLSLESAGDASYRRSKSLSLGMNYGSIGSDIKLSCCFSGGELTGK